MNLQNRRDKQTHLLQQDQTGGCGNADLLTGYPDPGRRTHRAGPDHGIPRRNVAWAPMASLMYHAMIHCTSWARYANGSDRGAVPLRHQHKRKQVRATPRTRLGGQRRHLPHQPGRRDLHRTATPRTHRDIMAAYRKNSRLINEFWEKIHGE